MQLTTKVTLIVVTLLTGYGIGRLHRPGQARNGNDVGKRENLVTLPLEAGEPGRREPLAREGESGGTRVSASPELQALSDLQALARLQQKLGRFHVPLMGAFDIDGLIGDGFKAAFALSPEELASLRGVMLSAQAEIAQAAQRSATAQRDGDAIVVAVPAFDGAPAIYDRVADVFARTLGQERWATFVELGQADQIANFLSGFGADRHRIVITRREEPGRDPVILIEDAQLNAAGAQTYHRSNAFPSWDMVPERFRWLQPFAKDVSTLPPRPALVLRP